jgi:hypothetical protein
LTSASADAFVAYDHYSSEQVKNITVVLERELKKVYDFVEHVLPCESQVGTKMANAYCTRGCGLYVAVLKPRKRTLQTVMIFDTGNFTYSNCPQYNDIVTNNLKSGGFKISHHFGRGD